MEYFPELFQKSKKLLFMITGPLTNQPSSEYQLLCQLLIIFRLSEPESVHCTSTGGEKLCGSLFLTGSFFSDSYLRHTSILTTKITSECKDLIIIKISLCNHRLILRFPLLLLLKRSLYMTSQTVHLPARKRSNGDGECLLLF